jgi:hypothetical protein
MFLMQKGEIRDGARTLKRRAAVGLAGWRQSGEWNVDGQDKTEMINKKSR